MHTKPSVSKIIKTKPFIDSKYKPKPRNATRSMATIQAHYSTLQASRRSLSPSSSLPPRLRLQVKAIAIPTLPSIVMVEEPNLKEASKTTIQSIKQKRLVAKLYTIADAAADRAEMHDIIGVQRDNWNSLLLNATNSIILTASTMVGISMLPVAGEVATAFKISSGLLYATATGIMMLVNKIQPSQLAEEQRNATRLFRQLERSIRTDLELGTPTDADVEEAMERVLALDKAYPLPLLPGMLEKFPKTVGPTVWWPKPSQRGRRATKSNGWSKEMEGEMTNILRVLKKKDVTQYVECGELVLKINRVLAALGPLLAGVGAVGSTLIGTPALGQWPGLVAVVGGALAAAVNTVEHGGQVGMVFELLRNVAGYYRRLEEEIEVNLEESKVDEREDGELFELKMALQLGRSVGEMRSFAKSAANCSCQDAEVGGFAGKLF